MRALPWILLLFCAWTGAAQVDEQPPVIRRVPNNPFPGQTGPNKSSDGKANKKEPDTMAGSGIVRVMDAKKVEVAIDDGRIFHAAIDSKTAFIGPEGKIDPAAVTPGTRVRISVKMNDEGDLTATSLVVEKPTVAALDSSNQKDGAQPDVAPKPEDDTATRKTEDADPDRPVLKRGMPQKVARKDDADDSDSKEETVAALSKPAAAEPAADRAAGKDDSLLGDLAADNQPELLRKAHQVNMEFITHLPNFVCQQFTTRYERENRIAGWQAKDIVSATVVYESRKEHYENIKINSRPASQDMMAMKGTRSTGEFGSFLEGLFARDVNAEFRYLHAESFRQVHTKVFSYTVKRENTDWTISEGGQSIEPAYSGRVWIDSETGRVMRIERQADNIPEAFPLSMVEQTLDYDAVMLGGRKVLLPVESSNLMCIRSSRFCSKNVIQFRDYKEFRGDASITFDK
jgi:hypothetical protein